MSPAADYNRRGRSARKICPLAYFQRRPGRKALGGLPGGPFDASLGFVDDLNAARSYVDRAAFFQWFGAE